MSSQQRAPVEEYIPDYVREDAEFDYCYGTCGCGWATEAKSHPEQVKYEIDGHSEFGMTPDCTLGKIRLIFEDGTEATI